MRVYLRPAETGLLPAEPPDLAGMGDHRPGDIVNGHRLSADGRAWQPVALASGWDRWAAFGIAAADVAVTAEERQQHAADLWYDCFLVFAGCGMLSSKMVALWRHCLLLARDITAPDLPPRVCLAVRAGLPPWTDYLNALMLWADLLPDAREDLAAMLPPPTQRLLLGQYQVMMRLEIRDVDRHTRTARLVHEQAARAVKATRQIPMGTAIMETWEMSDDPTAVAHRLRGLVANQAMPQLLQPRPAPGGIGLRDIPDVPPDPLRMVSKRHRDWYPPWVLAIGSVT